MSRRERATQLYMSACAGMEEKDDVRVVGRKCVLAKGTEGVVPSPACSIPSRATSFFLSFFTRQTSAGRQRRQGIEGASRQRRSRAAGGSCSGGASVRAAPSRSRSVEVWCTVSRIWPSSLVCDHDIHIYMDYNLLPRVWIE